MKYIYTLGEIAGTRWIIRNQWHRSASTDLWVIQLGKRRGELLFTLFGFQLVIFINLLK